MIITKICNPQNSPKLLDDLVAGQPVVKGSQNRARFLRNPVGGFTTSLTSLYGVDGRGAPCRRARDCPAGAGRAGANKEVPPVAVAPAS